MTHTDPITPGTRSSRRRAGYQTPCVTELPRRWDPTQGRERVVWPASTGRQRGPAGSVRGDASRA